MRHHDRGKASALPMHKSQIPDQRLSPWIRWPIRTLVMPFVLADGLSQKLAKLFFKTPYRQVGHCYKRGACCQNVLLSWPKWMERHQWAGKLLLWWNTEVNGFYLKGKEVDDEDGSKLKFMGCRYLKQDGSCGQYRYRPAVCRDWPRIEYFGPPRRLKGCGFRAVLRYPPKNKDDSNATSKD